MATVCVMPPVYTGFGRGRELGQRTMRRGISRRMMLASAAAAGMSSGVAAAATASAPHRAEQWGIVEITLRGGGPDVPRHNDLAITFSQGAIEKSIPAFW